MAFGNTKAIGGSHSKRGGILKRFIVIILPLMVLALAVVAFLQMGKLKPQPETKTEPARAAPVVTAIAEQKDIVLSVRSQGEVTPRTEINFAAQVGGKITYISPNLLEGGQFSNGEILLRIDPSDFNLRVTQAQANVAQAETALTRELSEADIAKQDWEDLGEGAPSALTLRQPQLAEARARLASTEAALEEAKLQQSRTIIRAPFNGRVREKLVARGEFIGAGMKLGRLYAIDIADIKLPLTDADLAKIGLGIGFKQTAKNPGPEVILSANVAGSLREWRGTITRTDSSYDASTRVLYAYAEVKDPYGKGASDGTPLASGLFVDATIAGRDVKDGVIIPRNALRGTDRVYIANTDNTLSIRPVEIASSSRDQVVVIAGLSAGESVITSPVRSVAEGMKIEIAKPKSGQKDALLLNDTEH
jgi:RND family efflux transporter MFP subunit